MSQKPVKSRLAGLLQFNVFGDSRLTAGSRCQVITHAPDGKRTADLTAKYPGVIDFTGFRWQGHHKGTSFLYFIDFFNANIIFLKKNLMKMQILTSNVSESMHTNCRLKTQDSYCEASG